MAFALALGSCGGDGQRNGEPLEPVEGKGPLGLYLKLRDERYVLAWRDIEGETAYRVSGTATYWPSCAEARVDVIQEIEFAEDVAPGSTEFALPRPSDGSSFFLKELVADVIAFNGEEVSDGMAFTGEPPQCE
ncbi:MAG: hypothetical protein Q8Q00_00570 [Dehalococcoidia bacterium]|nr:hypothetical protein [Dehalococcoidia bacterium]